MTTFALVHGAWHGGWCWERVAAELAGRGHDVIAPDLPCEDVSAGFEDYADVVVAALHDAGDDVVVVGHSLAGLTIPHVATRRPVRRLVFLCALLPAVGRSFADQFGLGEPMLDGGYAAGIERDAQARSAWADEALARRHFYADCAEADAHAAFVRLRPQATDHYADVFTLDTPAAVPASYILCTEDRMVRPEWSRSAAAERLGVRPVELPGSHS